MPNLIADKGRSGSPSFYGTVKEPKTRATSSNAPAYAALVLVGVALVFVMRNQSKVKTGPVLNVVPSYDADRSTIANLTNTVNTISNPHFPAGGTLPSIVWSPNSVETVSN